MLKKSCKSVQKGVDKMQRMSIIDSVRYIQSMSHIQIMCIGQTAEGLNMNELQVIPVPGGQIAQAGEVTDILFYRFISYLDAKPKTVSGYTRSLKPFFSWLYENGITRPQFEDIKAYRAHLLDTCKPATVQAYIFIVRRFFDWTEAEGIYPNVAGKIKGATIDREPKKDYLTSTQVKAVLDGIDKESLQGKRDYALVALMVTGGLRDVEAKRANIEDLRTAGDNTVIYIQGKGREEKAEYVIVPPQVERVLRAYLKERGEADSTQPLFISLSNNSKGRRMSERSISGICKAAMQRAGYDSTRLTAHSLRHTAVTLALIANGGNIQEAQQFARHKNIATTQIYAHNLEKQRNQCSRMVANSIF